MSALKEHLKEMISAPGLSGFEAPIREIIETVWAPLVDELSVSKIGSLHGLKRGEGDGKRPSLLIATHMDAIGLMVTKVHQDWLHITSIGGIDSRVMPGTMVTVHGSEPIAGMVIQPPNHTLPDDISSGPVPLAHLLIDTGLTGRQLAQKVRIGDVVSFATEATEIDNGIVAGHSLDNRASVAALTETLKLLQKRRHSWDVWAVASAQEETRLLGAATSTFALRPEFAIVVDVNFGQGPGTPSNKAYKLKSGPTLDLGANTHPKLHEEIRKVAQKLEIPFQDGIYSGGAGTDAYAIQVTAEGFPTSNIGIPLRYMHTPVEMIAMKDIERCARIMAEFICELDENFLEKLAWEE